MELLMNKNELLDLGKNTTGIRIICVDGRCWVTRTGDSRDHIINAGESFFVEGCGQLVIHALQPSRLMLGKACGQQEHLWSRIAAGALKHSALTGA